MITYLEAIREAQAKALADDPRVYIYGQDVGEFGGAFKATTNLAKEFPGRVLDAPISEDDATAFGEIVGDEEALTPFELLRDKNLRDEISDLLSVLDDREKRIIFSRFGLDGGKPRTLEEVGKRFGVTRERIRQLQNIALSKLRRALQKKERPAIPGLAGAAGSRDEE